MSYRDAVADTPIGVKNNLHHIGAQVKLPENSRMQNMGRAPELAGSQDMPMAEGPLHLQEGIGERGGKVGGVSPRTNTDLLMVPEEEQPKGEHTLALKGNNPNIEEENPENSTTPLEKTHISEETQSRKGQEHNPIF